MPRSEQETLTVGPKNKGENEEGTDKPFVSKKVNLLRSSDVVFDDRT